MDVKRYISDVTNGLGYSKIDGIYERASRMQDVINLAMGQPDFRTPEQASKAGIQAIEEGKTKYTDDMGVEELREAVAKDMKSKYDLSYNPLSEIIILSGVSSALDTALRTIINPGDEVIVHQPCFNTYVPSVLLCGGKPVIIDTLMEEGFKLTPEKLKAAITPKTKALILSYPNNPTGAMMSREDLESIAQIVKENNILVLSDEIYGEMVYEGEFVSFASLPDMKYRTITLNGVSKTYSMTGWRVGYACAHADIVDGIFKVQQNTVMNVPSMSQYAAMEAINSCSEYVAYTHSIYNERRNYVVDRIKKIGLGLFVPKGAFYVFPSIKETGLDSDTFCSRLLDESKVAAVPGNEFGRCGEGFIRCSYTTTIENLEKGMDRIEEFVKKLLR